MPALVNYSGDDEFYSMGSLCNNPMDLARFCSIGSQLDIYSPPCKRARVSSPFAFGAFDFDQKKQPSIDVLPDECLFEIFRRIQGGKERSTCACVSKRWLTLLSTIRKSETCKINDVEMESFDENLEIGSDGYLTRSLDGKKATDTRLAAISVGTSGSGGLGKLSIRGSNGFRGVTNRGLSAIASGCPSLRALSLWGVPLIDDEGLLEIAKECNSLKKLDLCNCPSISNRGLIAIAENCPNLTSLSIESCPKVGNEGLQAIGKHCTKLQSISINNCSLVGDQGVSTLLSSATDSLTKIKLQSLNITDFSLAVIGHYGKSATNLVLNNLQQVSEKGFWVMGNAQGLQKLSFLTISSCRGVTDVSLEAIARGCSNLKQMFLKKCCFISDNGLISFTRAAASLESLQLEECNRVTQSGIIGAITNCGLKLKALSLAKCMGIRDIESELSSFSSSSPCCPLKSLSIRNCPGFRSSSLGLVGKLCPQLQHLDLTGLCGITDSGLLPLLESCEAGLVKVNLSGCMSLTDSVVSALARLHGKSLELLNLDGCGKITDLALMAIAEQCLFLRDLDLSKCRVTDSGLAILSSADQLNLQVLSLSGCSSVSSRSFDFVKKLGRTLVGLNLQNCSSISSSTFELLVENLWRCDILS